MMPHLSLSRCAWLFLLLAAPALAWSGLIDRYSALQISDSLTSAGLFYATARGINGIVSVIQGTELDLPFLTLAVGEVLDPVNDLVERFSGVILFALASLALQQLLQIIVMHDGFNLLLTLLSLLAIAALLAQRSALFTRLLRYFLLAVFVRFAFALVIIANHWVDMTFLREQDQARHQAMQSFEGELKRIQALSNSSAEFARERSALETSASRLDSDIETREQQLSQNQAEIAKVEARLEGAMASESLLCRVSLGLSDCSAAVETLRGELSALRERRAGLLTLRQASEAEQAAIARQSECLDKRQRGEACSLLELVPELPDVAALRERLQALEQKVSDFASNLLLLLTSVVLKSVLIPIAFLYFLVRLARLLWRRLG